MNTTVTLSSDHSWSRRCSTETVFSIQGKETDIARDTSDSETTSDTTVTTRDFTEFEPVTDDEQDGPVDGESSAQSDNDIITTKVIEVTAEDDRDMVLADSEQTDTYDSDSETDLHDFMHCVQCRAINNNPLYRYCNKCFEVRKSLFPPRPKRKRRKETLAVSKVQRTLTQDSGVDTQTHCSQELDSGESASNSMTTVCRPQKRRADFYDRKSKRKRISRTDSETDFSDTEVKPIVKTQSDPSISVDKLDPLNISKKVIANSLKDIESNNSCVICFSEPKSGVFVHGRIAHICCCYKCAIKVWAKMKRCPVCNCKVSNVLRAVVM